MTGRIAGGHIRGNMTEKAPIVVNMHKVTEAAADVPAAWTHFERELTPAMKAAGPGRFGMGRLGMNARRVPPGYSACPAHSHIIAGEILILDETSLRDTFAPNRAI